jgi:type III secretory pathway lipoprotein EscJ
LGAEAVEQVEPLLVTRNPRGEVEGVKYDRVAVVLVNAIKEQQQQIAAQQSEIETLRSLKAENARLKMQLAGLLVRLERLEKRRAARR